MSGIRSYCEKIGFAREPKAEYRHLFRWDHQECFCPINSRYGRAFSFSPFGPGVRGVPRPNYKGIPRGLDETDIALIARLTDNTRRIRFAIASALETGQLDDARKMVLNFYWLKLGAHELLFDRVQLNRDRHGKIKKGRWGLDESEKWTTLTGLRNRIVHTVLSSIYNEAIDDGLCDANPTRLLLRRILPSKKRRDVKSPDPFSIDDRDRFEATARRTCSWKEQMLLKVMAHAGLRLGEALVMREEYFDPRRKTYTVCQGYKRHRFKKPKGGKTRVVDLPEYLVDEMEQYIRELKKESLEAGRGGEVVLSSKTRRRGEGGPFPLSQRKAQRLIERVCKAAGLRVRNPHDLRHTYATIMLMAHVSPAYVQRQLGHSSIAITVDRYCCHWFPGEGRGDLEGALRGRVRKLIEKSHMTKRKGCNHNDYNPLRIFGAEGGNSLIMKYFNRLLI